MRCSFGLKVIAFCSFLWIQLFQQGYKHVAMTRLRRTPAHEYFVPQLRQPGNQRGLREQPRPIHGNHLLAGAIPAHHKRVAPGAVGQAVSIVPPPDVDHLASRILAPVPHMDDTLVHATSPNRANCAGPACAICVTRSFSTATSQSVTCCRWRRACSRAKAARRSNAAIVASLRRSRCCWYVSQTVGGQPERAR